MPTPPKERYSAAATESSTSGSPTYGRRTMRSIRSSRLSHCVVAIDAAATARGSKPPRGTGACRAPASKASIPSPRRAEIGNAGNPVSCVSVWTSIRTPRRASSSAIFSASTIGRCSDASRLRSSAAASMICKITPSVCINASTAARSSALCGVSAYIPGRSVTEKFSPPRTKCPSPASTLTPAKLPVRRCAPHRRLNSVLLPELGFPHRISLVSSAHLHLKRRAAAHCDAHAGYTNNAAVPRGKNHLDRRPARKTEALQIPAARRVGRQCRNAAARAARKSENAHISSLFSEKVLYCCIKICIIRR